MSYDRYSARTLVRLAATGLAAGTILFGIASPGRAAAAPPTPLSFHVTNVTATTVSLQWSPGYLIEPTRWQIFQDGDLVTTSPGSAYLASGLAPGGTYAFHVVAVHLDGTAAAPTRTITVTTRGTGVAPGTPSDPRAVAVAPARVTVEFDRPGDEFDVSSYQIFDGATLVATVGRTPFAHPTGTVDVRSLTPGSSYSFTVRAMRPGGLSAPSAPLVVTTPATTDLVPPTVPTGLSGELAAYTCDLASLTWTESTDNVDTRSDIDYEVNVDGSLVTVVRGAGVATGVPLPGPGTHAITVRAVDSSGNASAHSAPTTITVDPTCEP